MGPNACPLAIEAAITSASSTGQGYPEAEVAQSIHRSDDTSSLRVP